MHKIKPNSCLVDCIPAVESAFLETCICLYMSSIGLCLIHLIIMTDMSDAHDLNNNLGV